MKNDLSCEVVRDLLPSYLDGVASGETKAAVERHMEECPDCRETLRRMKEPEETALTEEKEIDYLKMVRRRSSRKVAVILAIVVLLSMAAMLRLFYIGLSSATESKKRIRNRVEKGGHDIPSQDVERRFAHRWQALTQVLPYCDEATFFDNENGFVEVAEYRNGELVVGKADQPAWVYEMEDYLRTHLWENILGKEHRELQR